MLTKTAELFRCPDFGVMDVCKATKFQEGHVPGAINIAHTGLLDRERELDKGVHCR